MSKIIQAVNAMISNPDKISSVSKTFIPNEHEYYFLYKNKYKWSICSTDDNEYSLFYYADEITLDEVKNYSITNWQELSFVKYLSKEINTKEAFESFSELYRIVNEKALGIDDILSDIISDMNDLPF